MSMQINARVREIHTTHADRTISYSLGGIGALHGDNRAATSRYQIVAEEKKRKRFK